MHDDVLETLRSQLHESTTEKDMIRIHLQQAQQAIIHAEMMIRTQRVVIGRLRGEIDGLRAAIATFQDDERDLTREILFLRVVVGVLAIALVLVATL